MRGPGEQHVAERSGATAYLLAEAVCQGQSAEDEK
jgi:hypothetical protein